MTPSQAAVIYRSMARLTALLNALCVCGGLICRACQVRCLLVDAASVASDMATARWIAGPEPRGQVWREIPG